MTNEQGLLIVIGELRASLEEERTKLRELERINNEIINDLKLTQGSLRHLQFEIEHEQQKVGENAS